MKRLEQIETLIFGLVIFTLPINLFKKFFIESSYVHGLSVDYLLPKLYISDVFVLLFVIIWLIDRRQDISKSLEGAVNTIRKNLSNPAVSLGLSILFVFVARQFFSEKPIASLWMLVKILEFGVFGHLLFSSPKLIKSTLTQVALAAVLVWQSFLAYYQFFAQKSLLPYVLSGEPNLQRSIGIARGTWFGATHILPYGSTPHPNMLGGVLAVFWLLLLGLSWQRVRKQPFLFIALSAWVCGALILTRSISAGLILAMAALILLLKKYRWLSKKTVAISLTSWLIGALLLIFISSSIIHHPSISRRRYLQDAAFHSIIDHPLLGTGLNTFTYHVEEYTLDPEVVRFVQPVHHVFLLWLAETGLLGLFALTLFASQIKNKKGILLALAVLSPALALDHYFISQHLGLLLATIFIPSVIFEHNREESLSIK